MHREVMCETIQIARESRGLTQKSLAEITHISQGHISKLERGEWSVPKNQLRRIAEVLEYPEAFFFKKTLRYGFELSYIYHRKRQSISRQLLKKIEAEANIRIMQVDSLLDGVDIESQNEFDHMDIQEYSYRPEEIARFLRAKWNIPQGPIMNLTEVVENAGGFIFKCEFGTKKLDGISMWSKMTPPLFFMNKDMPADRYRFSLAHELGHAIMHRIPTDELEEEANKFAAEFLMPKMEIVHDLRPFSLSRAVILKSKWRVSIAAIVKRAYDLGIISKSKYSQLFREINYRGMRLNEPIQLPNETPSLFKRVVGTYQKQLRYTLEDVCKVLNILPKQFLKFVM